MKKLLMMAFALLVSGTMLAQGSKVKGDTKSFIAFHGGPSFPIGAFSSKDMANSSNAGFAKTGFNLNLNYGYHIQNNIGLAAGVFYNKYMMDGSNIIFTDEGGHVIPLNVDHWQFYGVTAGPAFTFGAGKNINADLRIMGGVVNANAPLIKVQDIKVTEEEWNVAPVFQAGLDFRIGISNSLFIYAGADYMYIDPKFKYTFTPDFQGITTQEFHQKMNVINVTGGFGYKF